MALNKSQYESIIKEYELTQDKNRHLLEQRRAAIYEQLPEYRKLEESTGSVSVSLVGAVIDGQKDALKQLHDSLHDITLRKQKLLTDAGYPADYLEPVYDCPDCKDTGFLVTENGLKEKCHCFRSREISLLYDQSNIREMISSDNFGTLSYSYYEGQDLSRFERAVKICREFVETFKEDYHNLFFYGTVGTGKSFLSGCVANELLKQGCSVIYFSSSELFETLARYSFDKNSKELLYDFYHDLYHCDLIIIDDLGTELTNSFVASQLFSCLNERHLRRKATIISTNLSLEELRDRYSDRVFSRITSNFDLCKLSGPDIRMYKKRNSMN